MEEEQYSENFTLHFGGRPNEIDSKTLGTSLIALTTVVEEVNDDLNSGKKIELRVKTPLPGSFELPFDLVAIAVTGMLSGADSSLIKNIVNIVTELIKLKLGLKGERPQNVETIDAQTKITNSDGNVTYVDNRTFHIFNRNTTVTQELERSFQSLEEDQRVTDFQLMNAQKQKLIDVPRDDFHYLTIPLREAEKTAKSETERVDIRVFKIVFDRRTKWEFIYRGMRISAKIIDEVFQEQIESGERFGKGDILSVDLQINRTFDSAINTFINKSYEVVKVFKHIPREQQMSLWPEE